MGRSGAGVTAESFYKQLPMILIPLENKSSRGDQVLNAKYYEKLGVCKIVRERDLTPTLLLKEVKEVSTNLKNYTSKYNKIKPINGSEKVIGIINEQTIKKAD